MVYATIRQHGDAVTTEKTTEKSDEGVNEGVNGQLNGPVNGFENGTVNGDDRVNDSRNDSRNDSLSDSVNGTYQAIKANPGIQRKRISELTGKSIPTIDRHIALLAKSNLIEHRNSDKTGGYYVKK